MGKAVGTRLAELQGVMAQVRRHLYGQCQGLSTRHKQDQLSAVSLADWLGQTQQLEEERAGLIE